MVAMAIVGACGGDDDDAAVGSEPVASSETTAVTSATSDGGSATSAGGSATSAAPSETSSATSEPGGEEPVSGGTIEFLSAAQADEATLDAARNVIYGQTSGVALVATYDTLINVADDGTIEPRLAEAVTANDDFTEWTVELEPDVVFTDDTPFDAEAVAAHWTRVQDPNTASPANAAAQKFSDITVVDDLTVRVTLTEPDAQWPDLLTSTLGMIPSPTAVETHGETYGTTAETTVGAGPFSIASWVRDDRITFERNEQYWDAPRPYVDELVYRLIPDSLTRYNAFTSGEGDINIEVIASDVRDQLESQFEPVIWQPPGGSAWAINTREGHPTSNALLRQVLVDAVDKEATVARAVPGAEPLYTLFREDSPFYSPIEQASAESERATELMAQYLEETGQDSVTVNLVTNGQLSSFAEAFKQDWDKIPGLNVEIEVVDTTLTRAREGTFDLIPRGIGGGSQGSTPRVLVDQLLSTSTSNVTGVANDELDQALLASKATDDPEARQQAFETVQEVLLEEAAYLYTYQGQVFYFPREGINGLEIMTNGPFDPAAVWRSE